VKFGRGAKASANALRKSIDEANDANKKAKELSDDAREQSKDAKEGLVKAKLAYEQQKKFASLSIAAQGKDEASLVVRTMKKMAAMTKEVDKAKEENAQAEFESNAFAKKSLDGANTVVDELKKTEKAAEEARAQAVVDGVDSQVAKVKEEVEELNGMSKEKQLEAETIRGVNAAIQAKTDKDYEEIKVKVKAAKTQLKMKRNAIKKIKSQEGRISVPAEKKALYTTKEEAGAIADDLRGLQTKMDTIKAKVKILAHVDDIANADGFVKAAEKEGDLDPKQQQELQQLEKREADLKAKKGNVKTAEEKAEAEERSDTMEKDQKQKNKDVIRAAEDEKAAIRASHTKGTKANIEMLPSRQR
jgi:hypothetical protein